MKIAIGLNHNAITDWPATVTFAQEAERVGVDSLWTAEAWSHDAATPIAYLMAKTERLRFGSGIFQIGTRSPALIGMTAQSLDQMSGGRFMLGLGTSGPQVIEGWHGLPFRKPLQHTREVIEIVRRVMNGETVAYDGEFYQLPLDAEHGGTGEGKALRSGAPITPNLPIYVASLGPANLRLTGALADGWLGGSFIPEYADLFLDEIRAGAKAAGRDFSEIDIGVGGTVVFTDDPEQAAAQLKPGLAFSLGAMGSKQHNFYNAAYSRQGWADEAKEIQRLWLSGQRDEARKRVPTELVLATHLIGDRQAVKDRLRVYRDAGVTTFRAGAHGDLRAKIETLAQLAEVMEEVKAEAAAPARGA
ncbi:MAG: F420-dependent methylene-tetrahydromethanopterin reductase [Chloroflexi bacterium HGW-Chloroflexi-9]|nr:MAG: F420-dependent methylene-tetrahydromethanopterin reductase [Chloroflexi bacterium HGW-Chloroflexi-9]